MSYVVPLPRSQPANGDGEVSGGGAPRSCGTCRHRVGLLSEPWTWHCAIVGYSVRQERSALGADGSSDGCGPDGYWWEQREPGQGETRCAAPRWWRWVRFRGST